MIAFEVWLNGRTLCVAGAPELNVLAATLTWVRRHPPGTDARAAELRVGGSTSPATAPQQHDWSYAHLSPGDELRVIVIEAATADPPATVAPL